MYIRHIAVSKSKECHGIYESSELITMQVWTTTVDIYKMSFFDHRELLRVLLLENTCICTLPIVDLRPETYSEEPYFNFLMQ